MAIVYWTLAGSAPENGSKGDTSQEGRASEEEPGEKKTEKESSEERRRPAEKEMADLEDKVCSFFFNLLYMVVLLNLQSEWPVHVQLQELAETMIFITDHVWLKGNTTYTVS